MRTHAAITFLKEYKTTSTKLFFYACCYISLVLNIPFLSRFQDAIVSQEKYSTIFLLSTPIFLLSLVIIVQGLITFRWLLKPVLIFTIIVSSLIFYTTSTYGIVFDFGMVQNTFETDTAEALSYVNIYSVLFFSVFGLAPSLLICFIKITPQSFLSNLASHLKLLAISFLCLITILGTYYSNYASVGRNNSELINYITPYKMLDSAQRYIVRNFLYPPLDFKVLDPSPTISNDKKHVMVLVLGETARSSNFSLNGYDKFTNPYTSKQNVISFKNVTSCGTATAVSVPCMFSNLNKSNYDKRIATSQQNAIDLIKGAGADVLWISNNNGSCKGVCKRVESKQVATDSNQPLCDGEYCYDEVLLKELTDKLNNLTHKTTLIVFHLIGSHGPTYYKRYPIERRLFTPDCPRSDIQYCTQEQLVNAYDNTIAYTDYVISEMIDALSKTSNENNIETTMLYISDHGESLGENGVYLHGLPYAFAPEVQKHVPMIYWDSENSASIDKNCLQSISNTPISHDNFFNTLLGTMSINSKVYNPSLDAFSKCKKQFFTHKNRNENYVR